MEAPTLLRDLLAGDPLKVQVYYVSVPWNPTGNVFSKLDEDESVEVERCSDSFSPGMARMAILSLINPNANSSSSHPI